MNRWLVAVAGIVMQIALGAVYGIAGFVVFNWLETRARRDGRLEGV